MSMRHVVVWGLAASGCGASNAGGGGGTPDAGAEEAQAFTQAQAKLAGEALAAGVEEAARRYGPVAPAPAFDADCVATSGDLSDADGDTIPASGHLTFDCSERRLGYTGTLTGTESITDEQPSALAWAFTASADLSASLTGPFGGSMVVDTDGAIVASQGSTLGPYVLASTFDVVSVVTNVRGRQFVVTEALDASVSYAPGVDWTPGGPVVTGELAVDGAWNVDVDGVAAEATLSTPTPLVLLPSCDTLVTEGRVEAAVAFGATEASIAVEWSGCGQSAVTYEPPAGGI